MESNKGSIGTFMILGGFVSIFLSVWLASHIGDKGMILFLFAIFSIIIGYKLIMDENKEDNTSYYANRNIFQNEYDEYVEKWKIVKSNTHVTLFELDKYGYEVKIPHYFWIADDYIQLFPMADYYLNNRISSISRPDTSELELKSIPIHSILYFEEVGELRKYTTISGGGSSLKGALLGYAIAKDVGAIIGSREPITTNIVSEDSRKIELFYKNQDDQIENYEFSHDAYDVFKRLIPLKELRKIISLNAVEGVQIETDANIQEQQTVKEMLTQLKDLQDKGIITEKEFAEQKKKILDTM